MVAFWRNKRNQRTQMQSREGHASRGYQNHRQLSAINALITQLFLACRCDCRCRFAGLAASHYDCSSPRPRTHIPETHGMSQSAAPATRNDMRTSSDTLEKTTFCNSPHRHGNFSATTVARTHTHIHSFWDTWNVTMCHARHAKQQENIFWHHAKDRSFAAPPIDTATLFLLRHMECRKVARLPRETTGKHLLTGWERLFCGFPHRHANFSATTVVHTHIPQNVKREPFATHSGKTNSYSWILLWSPCAVGNLPETLKTAWIYHRSYWQGGWWNWKILQYTVLEISEPNRWTDKPFGTSWNHGVPNKTARIAGCCGPILLRVASTRIQAWCRRTNCQTPDRLGWCGGFPHRFHPQMCGKPNRLMVIIALWGVFPSIGR